METQTTLAAENATGRPGGWSAVAALTLCVGTLITSEFMPVSLLTPIASELRVTQGQAGQAIAVSGIFAVLTSLFISSASRRLDRRSLLLCLTGVMIVSGAVVASAPTYAVFMLGRALIGVVIGGFWSMSAATVMRLVPDEDVPRAIAMLNGGNALATTIAAPLGSFLGQYIGWRGAFSCVVPLGIGTLVWLFFTLPPMPGDEKPKGAAATFKVLRHPQLPLGMLAVALLFMGQFALFTYLRPFLETVTRVSVSTLSTILLGVGVAGLAGTYLVGSLLKRSLYGLLIVMPLAMALIALAITAFGSSPILVTGLLALWGLISTAAPVGWWTWLSKVLPDDAEAGGGLMVAVIQLAITAGAWTGGVLFDSTGYRATFSLSAALLCSAGLVAFLAARKAARLREAAPLEPAAVGELFASDHYHGRDTAEVGMSAMGGKRTLTRSTIACRNCGHSRCYWRT